MNVIQRKTIICFFLIGSSFLIYWPGIHGPFLFDDHSSILSNPSLEITALSPQQLIPAAQSGNAGPLKRPVAMLSFALNYYLSGNFDSFSFKITNVIIHSLSAILLFVLFLQLLKLSASKNQPSLIWITGCLSLIWAVHPINLTSVLYVVQRMTSLSALFSLGCIISYIAGRTRLGGFHVFSKASFFFLISLCSLTAAMFSKENAALTPLIILLIELTLFTNKQPWLHLKNLPRFNKTAILIATSAIALFATLWIIGLVEDGFSGRTFTMQERLLTEARVICFYLSLILLPRINALGLFHDDIQLSTSLLAPWTTLASITIILILIVSAIYYRKRNPLYSLGIGWFFIGHLMESTILPLEIAHEHRNYFPSIGIIIALYSLTTISKISRAMATLSLTAIILLLGSTTAFRAMQWSSSYGQAYYEAIHHPDSPSTQFAYSTAALQENNLLMAMLASNKANFLNPKEIAYAIQLQHLLLLNNLQAAEPVQQEILDRIKKNRLSQTTLLMLDRKAQCFSRGECQESLDYYIEWMDAIIEKTPNTALYYVFKSDALFSLGKEEEAINSLKKAITLKKDYLEPLFKLLDFYLKNKHLDEAKKTIQQLKLRDKISSNPRTREITEREKLLYTIKQSIQTEGGKLELP